MKPSERDAAYLWDMLDAARRLRQAAGGADELEQRKLVIGVRGKRGNRHDGNQCQPSLRE